jgi:S1 RNA binding domain protein
VTGADEIVIGAMLEGTVTGIPPFGVFVLLPNGKTGLVHISEVASSFVHDIRQHVQEQATVRVKVVGLDAKGKIALSIRQADPGWEARPQLRRPGGHSHSFEDKLARFLKESEDRMTDLRRLEGKRGGRGGRHG